MPMSNKRKSKVSPTLSFECILPREDHARIVMDWRNDPETLRWSFHSTPKKFETFYPTFLKSYFSMPELPPLFVLSEGERVAVVFFKKGEDGKNSNLNTAEISINVSPKHRGKGLGTQILTEIQAWAKHQGADVLLAEIKKENKSSHKAFTQAGFKEVHKYKKLIEDTGDSIETVLYRVQLTSYKRPQKVLIIAEAGSNWRMGNYSRDLQMGKTLIEEAAAAGADVVKFQTFEPHTIYVQNAGKSDYLSDAGIKEDIQDIFKDLTMPEELIAEFANHCKKNRVEFMSTPFSKIDFERVDPFVKRHKIASYEISHPHLLELAAKSGKPLILSTGASTESDIAWAVETFYKFGGKDLTLLQCTAKYPAGPSEMNLRVIPWLMKRFGVYAGLSDHSKDPLHAPLAAVALGATVIEKHFTIDKRLPGPDHSFAITPKELRQLVEGVRHVEQMLGSGYKGILKGEEELLAFARRGVQATIEIKKGDTFKEGKNIEILRPGKQPRGVHPRFLKDIEGKKSLKKIPVGHGLQKGDWE